jgi:hypothetical protein
MTLPTATHPAATNTAAALVRPAMDRHAISTAMIADMLANASNIRMAVSNGTEYIPRALKCETAGVIDFVIMRAGVEVAVTGYPLTAGFNPDGGMHRITRFTGTNLWGII